MEDAYSRIDAAPAVDTAPAASGLDAAPALPPLAVSALVVSKAALIAALRLYVPQLVDVEAFEGEGFLLRLAGTDAKRGIAHEGEQR